MHETDFSLLNRVIRGDDVAWAEFVRWYLPLVYHWCRQWKIRPDQSADIAQEVFLKVSQGLPKFEEAESLASFRGWLRTISRNVMIDWLRKYGDEAVARGGSTAHQVLVAVEAENEESEEASVEPQLDRVDAVRNEFSEKTWNAFWLTAIEGYTGAEAGAKLGMGRGAIYQAKFRVATRLRAALGDDE